MEEPPPTRAESESALEQQFLFDEADHDGNNDDAFWLSMAMMGEDEDEDNEDEDDDEDVSNDDFVQFGSGRMKRAATLREDLQNVVGAPSDTMSGRRKWLDHKFSRRKWLDGMRKRDNF